MTQKRETMTSTKTATIIPFLFVFIYGSGFVGAKLGLPYAEPVTFLALRFAIAAIILGVVALILKASWKQEKLFWLLGSGLLLQGVFSVGTFYALYYGIKPALSALVIALQPLFVAVLGGFYLQEKVSLQRWAGLCLGIVGVMIVLADGITTEGISTISVTWILISLLGLTLGQLIQKKHCAQMNLWTGGSLQSAFAALAMLCAVLFLDAGHVVWHQEFLIGLTWMTIGVSLGAVTLLFIMLRSNTANQVASVFYGVPVAAALVAWPLFGQVPSAIDWLGFTIVAISVVIANKQFTVSRANKGAD
jgi:drug/metabolite transporter (DMT)-like permease